MPKWLRATLVVTGVTLAAIQIVRPSRTNPPEQAERTIHAAASINPAVSSVLQRSCNDCHSNSTVWPWYSHVAPVSWLVALDVYRGRRAVNLSEWGGYTPQQQTELLRDMCEEVSQGEMPGTLYVAMHGQARLNITDRQQFCNWAHRVVAGTTRTESQGTGDTPSKSD